MVVVQSETEIEVLVLVQPPEAVIEGSLHMVMILGWPRKALGNGHGVVGPIGGRVGAQAARPVSFNVVGRTRPEIMLSSKSGDNDLFLGGEVLPPDLLGQIRVKRGTSRGPPLQFVTVLAGAKPGSAYSLGPKTRGG